MSGNASHDSAANTPVFVHSLFRAGSTWMFDRFRRATSRYWCYQEPYHEATIWLQSNPDDLLAFDHRASEALRHPTLDRPYFAEVHELRDRVAHLFDKRISYDSFFDTTSCPAFDAYTHALIEFAPHRAMLQCCRSFGRVQQIRDVHGGIHIHLWRNPRDQWWSYQIGEYFDAASLAILQADALPSALQAVADRIGIRPERRATFAEEYPRLLRFPIDASGRYQAFYALWLFSQLSNHDIVDCNISIDALSAAPQEAESGAARLCELGIEGLDLSGCAVPHATLGPKDDAFFEPIEADVLDMFRGNGYSDESLARAVERQKFAQSLANSQPDSALAQGTRARSAALRYADTLKAARDGEVSALQRNAMLDGQIHEIQGQLHASSAHAEAAGAENDAQRARIATLEQAAAQTEHFNAQLAATLQANVALANSQTQLAHQQIELAQLSTREIRADADRLVAEAHARLADAQAGLPGIERQLVAVEQQGEALSRRLDDWCRNQPAELLAEFAQRVDAAREHLDARLQAGSADLTARIEVQTARLDALDASQAAMLAEVSSALNTGVDLLSKRTDDAIEAARTEFREVLAQRVDAAREHLDARLQAGSADLAARIEVQTARLDAIVAAQADGTAQLARSFDARVSDLERSMRALIDVITQSHQAEREATHTSHNVERARLEHLLEEATRDAARARERTAALAEFRQMILASRMGRWLASRRGLQIGEASTRTQD